MTKRAGNRKPGSAVPKLSSLYQRFAVSPAAQPTLDATFRTLCKLHEEGRDHIWSYYVRNLARPWWLALPQNRVDVLIGNPPWLAFRFMTEAMQKAFRDYSDERGLWHGAKVATHQDLSGLFLVRAVERRRTVTLILLGLCLLGLWRQPCELFFPNLWTVAGIGIFVLALWENRLFRSAQGG